MRRDWLIATVCSCALLLGTMAPGGRVHAAVLAQPTNLAVVHRSGQTFITWTEAAGGGAGAPHYRVYRYTQPITAANLTQARLLGEVATGSGRFYANRYSVGGGTWAPRYYDSLVIANRRAPDKRHRAAGLDGGLRRLRRRQLRAGVLCGDDRGRRRGGPEQLYRR